MNDKRTQIVYDDARHFVLTTRGEIRHHHSDPIHPWVKGSATLYSKEYFELVQAAPQSRRRGHPVGAALRERPGHGEERNRHVLRGLPQRHRLGQRHPGGGYDIVLLGQAEPAAIDLDAIQAKLASPAGLPAAASLREVGFGSLMQMLARTPGARRI